MPKNHIDSSELNSSTEYSLSESSQNIDVELAITRKSSHAKYFTQLEHIVRRVLKNDKNKLNLSAFAFYIYLLEVSGDKSTSWKSMRTMADEIGLNIDTLKAAKKTLQENSTLLGGTSLITIQQRYKPGTNERLSDLIIINDIMEVNIFHISSEFKNKSNVGEKISQVGGKTAQNNIPLNNNQKRAAKSSPPPDIPSAKMTTPFAAAAALLKEGKDAKQIEMLHKIYELRKEYIDAAENPIAVLLTIYRSGDGEKQVQKKEEAAAEQSNEESIIKENTVLAKAVFEELKAADIDEQTYTIRLRDNCIQISLRGGGAETLPFNQKKFVQQLERIKSAALQRVGAKYAAL
jgi:hypothetical protein